MKDNNSGQHPVDCDHNDIRLPSTKVGYFHCIKCHTDVSWAEYSKRVFSQQPQSAGVVKYDELLETVKIALTYRDFGVLNEYLLKIGHNKIPHPVPSKEESYHDKIAKIAGNSISGMVDLKSFDEQGEETEFISILEKRLAEIETKTEYEIMLVTKYTLVEHYQELISIYKAKSSKSSKEQKETKLEKAISIEFLKWKEDNFIEWYAAGGYYRKVAGAPLKVNPTTRAQLYELFLSNNL